MDGQTTSTKNPRQNVTKLLVMIIIYAIVTIIVIYIALFRGAKIWAAGLAALLLLILVWWIITIIKSIRYNTCTIKLYNEIQLFTVITVFLSIAIFSFSLFYKKYKRTIINV